LEGKESQKFLKKGEVGLLYQDFFVCDFLISAPVVELNDSNITQPIKKEIIS
jgi:hypothetical protein